MKESPSGLPLELQESKKTGLAAVRKGLTEILPSFFPVVLVDPSGL